MTERYPYQKNWEDLRFRQALPFLAIFLWIFFLFVFAVVGTLVGTVTGTISRALGLSFFGLSAALLIFGSLYFLAWKCPDCKKYYFVETGLDVLSKKGFYAKYCKHCSLPRYFGSTYFEDHWGSKKAGELIAARNSKP
jgi:hypothetical protein